MSRSYPSVVRHLRCSVLVTVIFIMAGCQAQPGVESMVRNEVYFGLSRPGGADVAPAEFEQFVEREIATRFPQGFTILPAQGHWREASGRMVKEESRMLIIFADSPADARAVDEICRAYRQQFAQEAVLRASAPARVAFTTTAPSH